MNQSSSIDYSENLINSIEEIERRKKGFIQGVIAAKKNELIKDFIDKRRNLVQDIMAAKGHRHLQDNAIDEINKNFLDSFSNQVLDREDSFVYDSTTRNCRIVSKHPAYIAGSSSNKLVSDFNIDDLSDVNKEIIKLYQDGMKENKMILKQSIGKLTTDKCIETIEAEIEKLKKKFDNFCDDHLSIEEINEAETIFYNLYKFEKSDTDVYRATIEDEKEIVVDKNSKFYDALDMCYYHYLENGIGLGGRAPKAKDITRPDTVVPLDIKDMKNAGPVEQQGARGIKVESGSVQYLYHEPNHGPNPELNPEQNPELNPELNPEQNPELNSEQNHELKKDDKHEQLLKKSLAQVYKDTHEKASFFDRMYSGVQGKLTGIKNLVFHGSVANYLRYKKSRFNSIFSSSLFDFKEVDIEEPKIAEEVVDEIVNDEEVVDEIVNDEEVINENVVDEKVVDEKVVDEKVVDEKVVDEFVNDKDALDIENSNVVATEKKLAEAEKKLAAAKLELAAANEQLAATKLELAAANEQLAATKLELAAANEQLVAKDEELVAANEELAATKSELATANEQLAAKDEELLRSKTRLSYLNAEQEKYKKYILQQIEEKNLDKKAFKQELENAGISYDDWIAYKKQQNSDAIMLKKYQIEHINSVEDEKVKRALKRKYGITNIELESEKPMIQEEIDLERQARRKAKREEERKEKLEQLEKQKEQLRIEEEKRKFEIERQQFIEKVANHYDDYHVQLIMIGGIVNDPNPYGVTIDEVLAYQAENGIGMEQEPKGKSK